MKNITKPKTTKFPKKITNETIVKSINNFVTVSKVVKTLSEKRITDQYKHYTNFSLIRKHAVKWPPATA